MIGCGRGCLLPVHLLPLLVYILLQGSFGQVAAFTEPALVQSGVQVASAWEATLEVRAGRHVNSKLGFSGRFYCYNDVCSYPGPTLVLRPGDNLTLTLVNSLGPDPNAGGPMNTMRDCNVTNLHTHGLHMNPAVDSIFPSAGSGESLVYHYNVSAHHFPGFHWYHAHHHGASAMQIMGGLFGAIIVKPSGHENIPASITDSDSHVVVISDMILVQDTEVSTGLVTQGCGNGFPCDASSQGPLCTGSETSSPFNPFRLDPIYIPNPFPPTIFLHFIS